MRQENQKDNSRMNKKRAARIFSAAVLLALLLVSSGCSLIYSWQNGPKNMIARQKEMEEKLRNISPEDQQSPERTEGSLWNTNDNNWSYVTDYKAFKVGDVLLVNIIESSNADKVAATKLKKESKIDGKVSQFLGQEKYITTVDGKEPTGKLDFGKGVSSEYSSSFDGDTETKRSGTLTARISTIVTEVFPNGSVKISGNQSITVNNEEQYLTVEGIVRPSDINPDNSIDSPLIANSRIHYAGNGVLADKQFPGVIGRIMDYIWPF